VIPSSTTKISFEPNQSTRKHRRFFTAKEEEKEEEEKEEEEREKKKKKKKKRKKEEKKKILRDQLINGTVAEFYQYFIPLTYWNFI